MKNGLLEFSAGAMPKIFYPVYAQYLSYNLRTRLGIHESKICLSFDNDYHEDCIAAEELLKKFIKYKIELSWAVIAKRVEQNPQFHEQALSAGHELINHSYSHPDNFELRHGDPRKFCDLNQGEVSEEIGRAHEVVKSHFGYEMIGFRAPHFRFHSHTDHCLETLGYKYTSNEFALHSQKLGLPYKRTSELLEIPLSAIPRCPNRIFETYRIFRKPDGLYRGEEQFFQDFKNIIQIAKSKPLLVTCYFDAMDIIRLSKPTFDEYLKLIQDSSIECLSFRSFISRYFRGAV